MKTAVRLVDGASELVLHPSDHYLPLALDVTSPAVREVVEDRADDDGEFDTTALFGGRALSLELAVVRDETAECEELLDALKTFLHPRSRPYLHVVDDGWAQERRIRLRIDQWSDPYVGYVASQARQVQLQWRCPDVVWEAADMVTETINADILTSDGLAWPITFPIQFAATLATGAATVTSAGTFPAHFTARLYGPCTGPRLINETTGEQIAFTSALVLGAGEYVEIDTQARTAYLLSDPGLSQLNLLDFVDTSWWRLGPGTQMVRYAPADAEGGSVADINYRPAWL